MKIDRHDRGSVKSHRDGYTPFLGMDRIQSIDVFRFIAIIAVITIHTSPFAGVENRPSYYLLSIIINQAARFAVPFFFAVSGFFYARKIAAGHTVSAVTLDMLKRLCRIWLFFSLVYIMPYNLFSAFSYGLFGPFKVIYMNLQEIVEHPIIFLFEGSQTHLWFLVSLSWAVCITSAFLGSSSPFAIVALFTFSLILYAFGLMGGSYSVTPIGVNLPFNTRLGPFFSTLFFVLGFYLNSFEFKPRHFYLGFLILILGYTLAFTEIYYLLQVYHESPFGDDYVVGTMFVGLGVTIMALSNHPRLNINALAYVGRYTLGVYAIHLIFVNILRYFDRRIYHPLWEIGFVFVVLLLSVATTLMLSRSKWLKKVLV